MVGNFRHRLVRSICYSLIISHYANESANWISEHLHIKYHKIRYCKQIFHFHNYQPFINFGWSNRWVAMWRIDLVGQFNAPVATNGFDDVLWILTFFLDHFCFFFATRFSLIRWSCLLFFLLCFSFIHKPSGFKAANVGRRNSTTLHGASWKVRWMPVRRGMAKKWEELGGNSRINWSGIVIIV